VHRQIDIAPEQRLVDLLGEQALAAELAQRLVLDPVAGGGDHAQADIAFAETVRRKQARPHMPRLPQGKRAAAGADQKGPGGQGPSVLLWFIVNLVMPGRSAGHPRILSLDQRRGWPGQARP
jgi:hypothetical protein